MCGFWSRHVYILLTRKLIFTTFQLSAAARNVVPREVLLEMAATCVERSRYQQLAVLVEDWPMSSFSLGDEDGLDFVQENVARADLQVAEARDGRMKMQLKMVVSVLQKALKLYNERRTRISILDITYFPLLLEMLVSFVVDMAQQENGLQLTIVADLVVTDGCLQKNYIEKSFNKNQNIKIQVNTIYFELTVSNEEKVLELLQDMSVSDHFDLSHMRGAQLASLYLAKTFSGLKAQAKIFFECIEEILPEKLKILDLGYNAINLNGDVVGSKIIHKFITSFPNLQRLSLGGNRLTNHLGMILQNCENLEYLNLCGTQLRQIDVSFIATLTTLKHLDLSSNKLCNKLNVLKTVFKSLRHLTILEMEECQLTQDCVTDLTPYLQTMPSLQAISLNNNKCTHVNDIDCVVFCDATYLDSDDDDVYY